MSLVLSLFPGIGLFDMAFEEEGFCVVRGPDLLWGGDVKSFNPPAGVFDGVIGGPPCQIFSRLRFVNPKCGQKVGNLIPEFERCVDAARPAWFVMENVPDAPTPRVLGYITRDCMVRDVWVGGETNRLRRFSFGTLDGRELPVEQLALHRPDPEPAALAAGGGRPVPVKLGGSGKVKESTRLNKIGYKTADYFREQVRKQGLPEGFDLPPFKITEKVKAIGNGVPLPMGRAIAKAVKRAMNLAESVPTP